MLNPGHTFIAVYFKYPVLIATSYRDCPLSPILTQAWATRKEGLIPYWFVGVFFTKVTQGADQPQWVLAS